MKQFRILSGENSMDDISKQPMEKSSNRKTLSIPIWVMLLSRNLNMDWCLSLTILLQKVVLIERTFRVVKKFHLGVCIELLEIMGVEIVCLQYICESGDLSLGLLPASGQHPIHELPDTHVFPRPWR